ncbi:MAG: hypothetical protein P8X62_08105, partial [Flavobacteriaceae bacterium]
MKGKLLAGKGISTIKGEKINAMIMYNKGKEYIAASILLNQHQKNQSFVQLQLLLQGFEIILKGILLHHDYNKHRKKLKKYGHDLIKLTKKVKQIKPYNSVLDKEFSEHLSYLNQQYTNTNLRYGSLLDVFIDPNTIDVTKVTENIKQLIDVFDKVNDN